MKDYINDTPGAPKAVGPYSQAVRVGETYYLSGQIGLNPIDGKMVDGGIEAQTKQVLANVKAVLGGQGLSVANVVKSTVFLTDLANFKTMNALYEEAFGQYKPARSTIQVAALPLGAIVEIEVIAVR